MKLSQILFSQGFGARRECEGLIASGHVSIGGQVHDDPFEDLPPNPQLRALVPSFLPAFSSDNFLVLLAAAEALVTPSRGRAMPGATARSA